MIAISLIGLACNTNVPAEPTGCGEGAVRRNGGSIEQERRVQVCVNEVWGVYVTMVGIRLMLMLFANN